ncbi:MAG TPA: hypothetical protein VNT81_09435 [Vicinamibacterales bacterium]|nr:hypothetical protein [Vicinamibacterales bacterium]
MLLPISIPAAQQVPLKNLSELDQPSFDALIAALNSAKPCASIEELLRQVASIDAPSLGFSPILGTVIGLRALVDSSQLPVTTEELGRQIAADAVRRKVIPDTSEETFASRLTRLLDVRSLAVTAKAYALLGEHQHPFSDVRIVTDVRPLFWNESESPLLQAHMIVHNLRLEDREGDSFYFALTETNLVALQKAIDRALVKSKVLRESIATTGIDCVEPKAP